MVPSADHVPCYEDLAVAGDVYALRCPPGLDALQLVSIKFRAVAPAVTLGAKVGRLRTIRRGWRCSPMASSKGDAPLIDSTGLRILSVSVASRDTRCRWKSPLASRQQWTLRARKSSNHSWCPGAGCSTTTGRRIEVVVGAYRSLALIAGRKAQLPSSVARRSAGNCKPRAACTHKPLQGSPHNHPPGRKPHHHRSPHNPG